MRAEYARGVRFIAIVPVVVFFACAPAAPSPTRPATSASASASTPPPATSSALATAVSPTRTPALDGGAPPAASRPFHLFAEGGVTEVVTGARTALVAGEVVAEVVGDELRAFRLPPPTGAHVIASMMVGRWPDRVFAMATDPRQRVGTATMLLKLDGAGWKGAGVPADASSFVRGTRGDVLLLGTTSGHEGSPFLPEDERPEPLFAAWASSNAAMDAHLEDPKRSPRGKECRTRIAGTRTGTVAENGDVVVASTDCAIADPLVATWIAGASAPTYARVAWLPRAIAASSASRVFAAGERTFGVFDGHRIVDEAPPPASFDELCLSASGTVWGLAGASAWQRTAPGRWNEITGPPGSRVACPHDDDDLWAVADGKVYRTRAVVRVLRLADARPASGLAACPSIFVQVATIPDSTPDSYDFPQTRAALRGYGDLPRLSFVVTTDRRFGATVPDLATGERVVAALTERMKGSKPQLVCLSPDVKRKVEIR